MRTRPMLLALAAAAGLALLVPTASAQDADCDTAAEVLAAAEYYLDGELVAAGTALQGNLQSGGNLTAKVTIAEGCETQLSLVSYEVDADATVDAAVAVSVDTQVLANGTHELTVEVPECLFQVSLVVGSAIDAASNPEVLYQAEGRLLAYATGGVDCALQVPPVLPCPQLTLRAMADGTVLLTVDAALDADLLASLGLDAEAVANATAIAVLRSVDGGAYETIATLDATATTYVDATLEEGAVATYIAVLVQGDVAVSLGCTPEEVTTVPDLGSMAAIAAAGVLGTALYAVWRRRQA